VLVAGWLLGVPVPLMLMWAPSWGWIVAANVLLGVNQGFTWSTTVIMKIDLAGPQRRGLAMGLNEAAGYGALAATAAATGWIATNHGLRPEPFLLGVAYVAIGLGLSAVLVRETRGHAQLEARSYPTPGPSLTLKQVLVETAWRDRSLLAINQAGLVNNLNDGLAWGLLPILFAAEGPSVAEVGLLAALYPAVWATGQLVTGAASDRTGRKPLIVAGMLIQAGALAGFAMFSGTAAWVVSAVALGIGTAFVYPTLLAAIGDVAHPSWRASAVGVYRLWRDSGYAIGALVAGIVADVVGLRGAVLTIAALTAASGLVAARLLTETHNTGNTMARTKVSHPLFARFYAWASPRMEKAGFGERRGQLLAGLTGRVLEVGAGNGMNFAHYPPEVIAVVAVEPEPHLRALAEVQALKTSIAIDVVDGTADNLPASTPWWRRSCSARYPMYRPRSVRSAGSSSPAVSCGSSSTSAPPPPAWPGSNACSTPPSGRPSALAAMPTVTPAPPSRRPDSLSPTSTSCASPTPASPDRPRPTSSAPPRSRKDDRHDRPDARHRTRPRLLGPRATRRLLGTRAGLREARGRRRLRHAAAKR
jgi:MFS family permease